MPVNACFGADRSPSYKKSTVGPQQSPNDTKEVISYSKGLLPALWHVVLYGPR